MSSTRRDGIWTPVATLYLLLVRYHRKQKQPGFLFSLNAVHFWACPGRPSRGIATSLSAAGWTVRQYVGHLVTLAHYAGPSIFWLPPSLHSFRSWKMDGQAFSLPANQRHFGWPGRPSCGITIPHPKPQDGRPGKHICSPTRYFGMPDRPSFGSLRHFSSPGAGRWTVGPSYQHA